MKFGDRLKEIRKAKGQSQKELGDLLELGQTTIANYEKNIRFPNPETLIQIANIYDVSIDRLVGRTLQFSKELLSHEELDDIKKQLTTLLMDEKENEVVEYIHSLGISGEDMIQIYEYVYKPILVEVGRLWQEGIITVAKEHYISGIMSNLIANTQSNPRSLGGSNQDISKGNVICLSLSSENHTLGIRMISDYFHWLGYKSYYLGTNVPTQDLIDLILKTVPKAIAISATMEYHRDSVTNLVEVLRSNDRLKSLKEDFPKVIVGGQAFNNPKDPSNCGADFVAHDFETLKQITMKM